MLNNKSIFVFVGKNIFDLNSITNMSFREGTSLVFINNISDGIIINNNEYKQLIDYFFSNIFITINEIVPKYVLVGKNMFVTNLITHVLYNNNNEKPLVFINNNPNGMIITENEYELLIKYLLSSHEQP